MQTSEMDRKREAFLEHLKYKYPHHATAIMGHQERLRDQTKSPKLSSSPQPSVGDPAEHLSEASADSGDMMFEADSAVPFVRGSRTRASLPVVRSTNQTKERSLGTLFLQYGDDTKKMQMPNEITSVDTIRALFVSAFPQQLTMKILESPSTAIYIKDEGRNVYYELSDVRNIQDRCFLKVYNKDPAHAFNHTRGAVNGDVRMQRDISYSVREGPAIHRPGSATYPSHAGPVSPPPTPVPHSMPSSPSRIPYGGGRPAVVQSNTMQRERIPSVPAPRSISPSPSAILERRDVKPDEDMGNKNVQLLRNDSIYQDPYLYHEGRMSMASSHGGHPLDVPDHIIAYHRGSLRSASTYSNSSMQMEMMEQSMYRQKSRKHVESHLPTLGSKTPPTSPHRVADIRMMEMHAHNAHLPPHGMQADRSSPLRQSFKKEQGPGMFVEAKVRNTGGIMGMADIVPSPTDKQVFGGYGVAVPPKDPYTRERMHAMEKQIASLTGLVQTALLKGPSPNNSAPSDRVLKSANGSASSSDRPGNQGVAAAKNSLAISETITVINQQSSTCSQEMHVSLQDMRRNVAELRLQLHKMRQLQLQNQETVRLMMKKAEMEISSKVTEMVKGLEDPVQRQRVLVEQERQKYLGDEEQIVAKLCDLEDFVESLKKDQSTSQRSITLKDVEDRAFMLRQIGEAVSNLKGEFPYLQNKMRAVLRVEVEAVRFLKEEPHKLDSLLKRIRNMTDALSALRRHATDGSSKSIDNNQTSQVLITERVTETDSLQVHEEKSQVYLQPTQTDGGAAVESPTTSVKSEVVPLSAGLRVHQVQSSPVLMQQSQHSSALVNHTPAPSTQSSHSTELLVSHQTASVPPSVTPESARRNPPTAAQEGSSKQSLFIEEMSQVTYRNRAVSIEEAERKFEEKRQNLDHYNGKEFEKMLEEAQASIMKAIPSLEVPAQSQKVEIVDKKEVTEVKTIMEQDNDKVTKSPPPPPPRRMYPPGSGLNSVWTAESTFLVRKDSSKDSEEALPKVPSKAETEEPHLQSVEATVKSSAVKDEDEEEEGARIMAELQVSKEGLNAEKPEEKWKIQNIQNPASESAKIRQGDTVIVNETFSLFTGREKYGECQTDKEILPAQECEKGDGSPLVSPAILEKRLISFSTSKETESGIPQPKREVLNVKVGEILHVEKKEEVLESHMTALKSLNEHEMPYMDMGQTVVLRPKSSRRSLSQQQSDDSNSPTTSPTETTSPADNIAFMITKTKVQVLSTGEVQDIVSRKGEDVQTFNIDRGNNEKILSGNLENIGSEDPVVCTDKKPVIIIFDEPMDIKSAYKRLSTIFEEGDDDLEKHMSEAKIEEEDEEEEAEVPSPQESKKELPMEHTTKASSENPGLENKYRFNYPTLAEMKKTIFEDANAIQTHFTDEDRSEASDDQLGQRQDVKKKFKFKFPKKQLAALTQAIRTGTKTGKKTLQVVVYEEEEEADGTIKQHKEAKRFEIARSSSKEDNAKYGTEAEAVGLETDVQVSRTDEIKRTTYKILDSLEQTIKQQENLISEMAPIIGAEALESREKCKVSSDIKTGAAEPVEEPKPVVETPSSIPTAARKGSSGGAQTSRMPIPMSSKSRQANVDKSSKQPKLQEPQRQYRQANGGTKKAGGDVKASAPSLSVSKIPGLSSNTGKSGSVPAQSSETSNPPNPSVKSHVANSNPQASRTANPSALVRPAHNGSSKLQPPPTYKGHHLSFSPQASNGRPALPSTTASSSSPPSSVSPTSLTQGVKSIRTIHTPSFTSYKSQNGSASKGLNAKETS